MTAEIARILKPGGIVFVAAPFHYPFHDAPDDFTRWTLPGLKMLLGEQFEVVGCGPRGGAMGVVILALAHVGGQLLCFGSERAYAIANFMLMAVLAPLKLLDLVLTRLPFNAHLCPNVTSPRGASHRHRSDGHSIVPRATCPPA